MNGEAENAAPFSNSQYVALKRLIKARYDLRQYHNRIMSPEEIDRGNAALVCAVKEYRQALSAAIRAGLRDHPLTAWLLDEWKGLDRRLGGQDWLRDQRPRGKRNAGEPKRERPKSYTKRGISPADFWAVTEAERMVREARQLGTKRPKQLAIKDRLAAGLDRVAAGREEIPGVPPADARNLAERLRGMQTAQAFNNYLHRLGFKP
jgi:hypothetical protein